MFIYRVIGLSIVVFRRSRNPGIPPLTCQDCAKPVVKTADGQFVCVGCEFAYHSGTEQQPRSIETLGETGQNPS